MTAIAVAAARALPNDFVLVARADGLAADPYAKIGVARISLGSALARVTHRVIFDAAKAMFQQGDFPPDPLDFR